MCWKDMSQRISPFSIAFVNLCFLLNAFSFDESEHIYDKFLIMWSDF